MKCINKQEGFINVLVIILVVAVIGGAGYYFVSKKTVQPPPVTTNKVQETSASDNINILPTEAPTQKKVNDAKVSPATPVVAKPPETAAAYTGTLKTYKNSKYGFEVKYPASLIVEEGKIEPNTRFVIFKNPNFKNARVNIIYINDGKSALTSVELSKGTSTKVGTRSGYKFTSSVNPLYWVDVGTYALAIYFEKPQSTESNYNEYLQISTFKF